MEVVIVIAFVDRWIKNEFEILEISWWKLKKWKIWNKIKKNRV